MEKHGFAALPSEWWHFDFKGWQSFDLLDITLEELPGYGSVGVDEAVEAR